MKKVPLNDWEIALSHHTENAFHSYYFELKFQMEKLTEKQFNIFSQVLDDRNTQNGLFGSEITFSSINKPYIERMLSFLNQSGF